MKRKILLLSLMVLLVTSPAWAGFINGGFEDGTFNGWTKDGGWFGLDSNGNYTPGIYTYKGDQGKSAIVSPGLDPIAGIPMVYSGNYSARINNSDPNFHFSTITQAVVWNDPNIYFAWAAVLQEPGHPHNEEPNFSVKLTDLTTNTVLYDMFFASDTIPPNLLHVVGDWKYTDWQVVNLDTSGVLGHTLELTMLAADCGQGAHGGYAYLDGFGAAPPQIPLPSTLLLLGSGLAGLVGYTRMRLNK
jgi:hypothetical protein